MEGTRWLARTQGFLAALIILGFGWGLLGLAQPADVTIATAPTATVTPPVTASGGLPRAWLHPTYTPTATATPTASPTATATPLVTSAATHTPTPSPTATATVTHTPRPTRSPSPQPSATPIHAPAQDDPTRITSPAIGLDVPVVPVEIKEYYENHELKRAWDVADYAAGFHAGMARPGHVGNTVLSGHNNIRGEVFRDIHKLKPGDDIFVWVGDSGYRYQVSALYRVPIKGAPPEIQQDNLRWIMPTEDERLTLVTCWPYWSNTHRTIVVAFPAPWN